MQPLRPQNLKEDNTFSGGREKKATEQEELITQALLANSSFTLETYAYKRLIRRLTLISRVCLLFAGASMLSTATSVWQLISNFNSDSLVFLISGIVTALLFVAAYFFVRVPSFQSKTPVTGDLQEQQANISTSSGVALQILESKQLGYLKSRADWVSFGLILIFIVTEALTQVAITGIDGSLTAGFLTIPVVAALLGFDRTAIRNIAVLTGVVFAVTLYIHDSSSSTFFLRLLTWLLTYTIVAASVITFTGWVWEAFHQEEKQTQQLTNTLEILNSTNLAGVGLGQEMASVTRELNATVSQQAGSSQEQVAAITQVTSSLEELNETAQQIAENAAQAAQAATQTEEIANQVKDASILAEQTSQQGAEAVNQTITSVERVRNRIELLGQRLLSLTEQTRKVGNIIDIIDEIADETHLLALNASIEAAGNISNRSGGQVGVAGGITTIQGERFGVIAQEIKGLSDRSREATEEVRQAITEMQGAVAAAVLVAEEGKKETAAAFARSQVAGSVIGKLNKVITDSAVSASEILVSVGISRARCEEISIATGQQKSASNQILLIMRNITQASQESASAVSQFTRVLSRVEEKIDNLNSLLNSKDNLVVKV